METLENKIRELPHIVVVDQNSSYAGLFKLFLPAYNVSATPDPEEAYRIVTKDYIQLLIVDHGSAGRKEENILWRVKALAAKHNENIPVVVMSSGYKPTLPLADYVTLKPDSKEGIERLVKKFLA